MSALTISVARLRILFIRITYSTGFSALRTSVTPSHSAICCTNRENIFFACLLRSAMDVYCKDYREYICVDQMGKLFRPNFVTEHFDLIKKFDLTKIRFHDLRHTCASLLLANGVPMKQIQVWLGHSTFSTTADIYAHLDMSAQIQTGSVAGALFGQGKSLPNASA